MDSSLPVAKLLTLIGVMFTNTLKNDRLMHALARRGYDADRIREGQQLHTNLLAAQHHMDVTYGLQYAATEHLEQVLEDLKVVYDIDLQVARTALANMTEAARPLALSGARHKATPKKLMQTRAFYAGALANPAIVKQLATHGLTLDGLKAGLKLLEHAEQANAEQEDAKQAGPEATAARNAAKTTLMAWVNPFESMLDVAKKEAATAEEPEAPGDDAAPADDA